MRVVTSALESEKLARGFAVSSRGFHFELNVRKSSLQMYANPWPGRKGISGIKSPFSIHRSSVMNRYDSIVDGSFICTSFEEKSWTYRRRIEKSSRVIHGGRARAYCFGGICGNLRAVIRKFRINFVLEHAENEFMRKLLSSTDIRIIVKTPWLLLFGYIAES